MRVKLFTLRFSPALQAFDDEALRSFCAGGSQWQVLRSVPAHRRFG